MTTTTTRVSRTRRASAFLLAAAAAMSLGACQSALSPSYDHADSFYQSLVVREIVRGTYGQHALDGSGPTIIGGVREVVRVDAAGPASAASTQPLAVTAIGLNSATLRQDEPVVNLSLQDAIARTVQHSLAIKVQAYVPALKESLIVEAMANGFDPVFFGQNQFAVNDDPQLSASYANGTTWNNQYGVRKVLPTGGQIQATTVFNMRDINVPSTLSAIKPKSSYTTNFNLQFTQPLLKGFGADVAQANIYLARADQRISQSEFKQKVMTTVADVEEVYQNLVLARTNVEVLERLVRYSEETYNNVLLRGDIDKTVVSENQAKSTLISRKADLHVARKVYRNASDRLKSLINDPGLDVNTNVLINPTDLPIDKPVQYDTLDSIETALRQRPEMQQARLQLQRADIVITVAKNDLLPKVDLTMAVQTNGLEHGLMESYTDNYAPMSNLDFTIGIKFEVPIGNRAAESALERHQNERRQAITNMVDVAQKVVVNVKQQLREVYSSFEEIDYREQTRQSSALQLKGIEDVKEIRSRTPEFLQLQLDSQARLAQAEQQVIQARVNYNLAIMRFEQAKGTLLEYDRISLDKAPKPADDPLDAIRFQGSTYLNK